MKTWSTKTLFTQPLRFLSATLFALFCSSSGCLPKYSNESRLLINHKFWFATSHFQWHNKAFKLIRPMHTKPPIIQSAQPYYWKCLVTHTHCTERDRYWERWPDRMRSYIKHLLYTQQGQGREMGLGTIWSHTHFSSPIFHCCSRGRGPVQCVWPLYHDLSLCCDRWRYGERKIYKLSLSLRVTVP